MFAISLILMVTFSNEVFADVKMGAKCPKLNITAINGNYQFTCIRVSGKLVWSSGKRIKSLAASPSPKPSLTNGNSYHSKGTLSGIESRTTGNCQNETRNRFNDGLGGFIYSEWKCLSPISNTLSPTASPSTSASPKETQPSPSTSQSSLPKQLFFKFKVEGEVLYRNIEFTNTWTTKDDRSENQFDLIRVKAWKQIKSVKLAKELKNQKITYFVAPNVKEEIRNAYSVLIKQSLLYFEESLEPNTELNIYIYTEKDRQYLKDSLDIYVDGTTNYQRLEVDLRNYDDPSKGFGPGGGVTASNLKSKPNAPANFATFYMSSQITNEQLLMYLIPHELAHHWQYTKMQPTIWRNNSERSSCNFIEGTAVLLGASITVNHLGWFSDEMDVITRRVARNNPNFKPTSEQDIVDELMKQSSSTATNSLGCSTGYSLGSLVYEWLVAEKGISILTEIMDSFNRTTSVSAGLRLATGWTDRELYTLAAPYVLRAWNAALKTS